MTIEAWADGWPDRFRSIVQKTGFEDTYDFVIARRQRTFGQMFGELRKFADGDDKRFLAFAHLREVFYIDAERRGQLRSAMAEALVRCLGEVMPDGWNKGKTAEQRRIVVHADWPVPHWVSSAGRTHDDWRALQDRVLAEIEAIGPPDDWCPTDSSDPVIQDAFRRAWPADG